MYPCSSILRLAILGPGDLAGVSEWLVSKCVDPEPLQLPVDLEHVFIGSALPTGCIESFLLHEESSYKMFGAVLLLSSTVNHPPYHNHNHASVG